MRKKLAFTGHRPESLPFGENENDPRCIRLREMLLTEITDRVKAGYDTFYTGCARGLDIVSIFLLVCLSRGAAYRFYAVRSLHQFLLMRLIRGATITQNATAMLQNISTHAPLARRDRSASVWKNYYADFYSRASHEARLS